MQPTLEVQNNHAKYINLLAKLASNSVPVGCARVTAAIVYKNEIISFGNNSRKTHPLQAKFSKNNESIQLHAEIDAIKNALKIISQHELSKSVLYVCRVKFFDETRRKMIFGISKPCIGCARAIANFNITKIVYTLDDNKYECSFKT